MSEICVLMKLYKETSKSQRKSLYKRQPKAVSDPLTQCLKISTSQSYKIYFENQSICTFLIVKLSPDYSKLSYAFLLCNSVLLSLILHQSLPF